MGVLMTTDKIVLESLQKKLEGNSTDLSKILTEIDNLPDETCQDLANMLKNMALKDLISATKKNTDKLDFLKGLESLIFDEPTRTNLLERQHLHRLIAENVWIFGEDFSLSVDDQSLNTVLKKHAELNNLEINLDKPVTTLDGKGGIVDLVLSRKVQNVTANIQENLIVELKRPNSIINVEALTQIEKYALAISNDERFHSSSVNWKFWLVGNDLDSHVTSFVNQFDREPGLYYLEENISVWVKTWAQIINDCRVRLQYFSDEIKYLPDSSDSLQKIKDLYNKYLYNLDKGN